MALTDARTNHATQTAMATKISRLMFECGSELLFLFDVSRIGFSPRVDKPGFYRSPCDLWAVEGRVCNNPTTRFILARDFPYAACSCCLISANPRQTMMPIETTK